ncbi:mobile mystery protein B [Polaromonas sp.]|uniref:mobile mystery protein B n=1 Tax=Polaromonas sp. TaxID=1869339 RepID=UPI002FC7D1C3
MDFAYAPGATPIDPDEAAGLLPRHITTQAELNTWEEANIVKADGWAFRQRRREPLEEGFVRDLHRMMFDKTWRWAGTFRSSNKNIGVDSHQVSMRLRELLDNTRYQRDHQAFPADELAVRFHHRLVWIHAFPNGNGRHARLMADVLVTRLGGERFTWGQASLLVAGDVRARYLQALRAADQGMLELLIQFARS